MCRLLPLALLPQPEEIGAPCRATSQLPRAHAPVVVWRQPDLTAGREGDDFALRLAPSIAAITRVHLVTSTFSPSSHLPLSTRRHRENQY
ncbi:hypothetical protein Aduo_002183 [Ancylostoma duodenale]